MGQGTLVEKKVQDGQRLIDRLAEQGVAVVAASWVKENESDQWYLYLATPLVGEDGSKTAAYRRVGPLILNMQQEGIWIEPLEIKVIGPHDPIARDILAHRPRIGVPAWFLGSRLGDIPIDEAYVYPPLPEVTEASKR
jgi:hypothetical protein